MGTFSKKIMSLGMGFLLSYSALAGNGDCVDCSVGGDQTKIDTNSLFRMERVTCIENDDPGTYDRVFCASLAWFSGEEDFQGRIEKCKKLDPKGRTTIGEYLNSLNCESRYIEDLKNKLRRDGYNIQGRTVTGLSAVFLDSDDVMGASNLFHDTIRTYRKMGKENGYRELKEFATVLNRKDDNGHTFLDNIMMRYNEKFVENVGLGVENVRARIIRVACKIGGTFSKPEHTQRFNCVSDSKYVD